MKHAGTAYGDSDFKDDRIILKRLRSAGKPTFLAEYDQPDRKRRFRTDEILNGHQEIPRFVQS